MVWVTLFSDLYILHFHQNIPLLTVWSFCHSADLLPAGSEDHEEASRGVSHIVLPDILVPVLDETAEYSLHKEASSAGLQEDVVKVCFCIFTGHWSLEYFLSY